MARNSRITVRSRSSGRDAAGQPSTSWQAVCTIWASIRLPSGVAVLQADAQVSKVRASISVAKRADISEGMQVVHGAQVYDIQAVLPDEQNRRDMYLVCEAAT
jgi:SPP1 family predicted phage head-tail adaptor